MRRTRFDEAPCPVARVTDLFGDWWTPLILRDALYGVTRFEDFQRGLGVSRAVLSQRLTRLVDEGLMEKVAYQERPTRHEYRLTDTGRDAGAVLAVMWRFGEDHLWPDGEEPPLALVDRRTGAQVRPAVVDEATGDRLLLEHVTVAPRS